MKGVMESGCRETWSRRAARLVWAAVLLGAAVPGGCRERTDISGYQETAERVPETELRLERVGTIEAKVGELRGVAIDAGDRVYLLGSAGVRVLEADGREVASWPVDAGARAVAVAADGPVYVALASRILKFDREGKSLGSWGNAGSGPGELALVTSVGVSGPDVLVADQGNLCIHRFDAAGRFINDIGKRDRARDFVGIVAPSEYIDFVIDADRTVIVGNPGRLRVESYTMDGKLLGFWGKAGFAPDHFIPCCNPTNVALTRDGNVVTAEKGLPRVKIYDRTGKLLAYVPQKGNFPKEAKGMDLAVDSKDRIYVVEPVRGVVMIFQVTKPPG